MPKKIEIDIEKLKALHAQGLSDREIGEKLGCSGVTIGVNRRALGLPRGRPGPRPAGEGRKPCQMRPARLGTRAKQKPDAATVTVRLSAAALDRLWNDLALDVKAECIEKILGN